MSDVGFQILIIVWLNHMLPKVKFAVFSYYGTARLEHVVSLETHIKAVFINALLDNKKVLICLLRGPALV
jgi:hypothetical protein